ncbi:MAG: DUF362 domain-containing protein [Bacilli bacterium]|nr:DUF362 domain-containing protein [Bacilli bacterium]
MKKSIVYFIKDITPENLIKIYKALGRELRGHVGVKISTGEMGGHNYLKPELIGPLVDSLKGTIIECCTAYGGSRQDPKDHWDTIKAHGFSPRFNVDLMDEHGQIEIPVHNGCHLDKDIVGKDLNNYDSILILSHFKGHMMGGFGGALKNISIGIASTEGKAYIHSAGKTTSSSDCWGKDIAAQDDFLESMADACEAVLRYVGYKNMAYINVANRLSVDCDCDSNPHEPEMADLGIYASLDPVALDQACYDAVKNAADPGKAALIERMDSRHAIHTVETAAKHGLGIREYEIVTLD